MQDAGVNGNSIPSNKIDPQSEAAVVSQVPGHNPEVDSSSEKSPDWMESEVKRSGRERKGTVANKNTEIGDKELVI